MMTMERFTRNIRAHASYLPFQMIMTFFVISILINAVTQHRLHALVWALAIGIFVIVVGFTDGDDDPQHPVPGWDPS